MISFSAARGRIFRLSRLRKIFILISLSLLLVILVEGLYYFLVLKEKLDELQYFDQDITYQEGVFLYSKGRSVEGEENEPIAIRGRVTKIDGWLLTLENQGKQIEVEIDKDLKYSYISEEPKKTSGDLLDLNLGDTKEKTTVEINEIIRKQLKDRGLLADWQQTKIDDLGAFIKVGNFVVISDLEVGEGKVIKGGSLAVLGSLM